MKRSELWWRAYWCALQRWVAVSESFAEADEAACQDADNAERLANV